MAKLIFLIIMAAAYVVGIHDFTSRAMTSEQHVAGFYTAAGNPDALLSSVSK